VIWLPKPCPTARRISPTRQSERQRALELLASCRDRSADPSLQNIYVLLVGNELRAFERIDVALLEKACGLVLTHRPLFFTLIPGRRL